MNILLIHIIHGTSSDPVYGAVPYYRMQKPHEVLSRLHPEFDYISSNTINVDDSVIKQTDLILLTRHQEPEDLKLIQDTGIKWGVDLDDYWHLQQTHLLSQMYKENAIPEKTVDTILAAHFVITSTELLAEKIYPFNKNVHVIPNGIDTKEWVSNKVKSNRIRFGFTQGTTHIEDVELIAKDVERSLSDDLFIKSGQICLCGYTGQPDKPSISIGYERMLTGNLSTLDPKYRKSLIKFRYVNNINQPYKRVGAIDVKQFYKIHNELDIIVAPLKEGEFNSCKSNIKMLEAGFMDCAVMTHNVEPYSRLMTKENSFDLSEKSFYEWQKYILNNPDCVQDKAKALKESVKEFDLDKITIKRKELYESLFN